MAETCCPAGAYGMTSGDAEPTIVSVTLWELAYVATTQGTRAEADRRPHSRRRIRVAHGAARAARGGAQVHRPAAPRCTRRPWRTALPGPRCHRLAGDARHRHWWRAD